MIKLLLSKIDKFSTRKRILTKVVVIVLLFFFSFVGMQFTIQYEAVRNITPPEKAGNPEAVEYFVNSFTAYSYIERLHSFVDYDSFLMKPLFYLKDMYFKKGEELLSKTDSSDVFFWTLINQGIYGLAKESDVSMSIRNLTPKEYRKVNDMIYNYIIKLLTYDFPLYINREDAEKLKASISFKLINHYLNFPFLQYEGIKKEQIRQSRLDEELVNRLKTIYKLYQEYVKRNKFDKANDYIKYDSLYIETSLIEDIYHKIGKIEKAEYYDDKKYCNSKDFIIYLKNLKLLHKYLKKHKNRTSKNIENMFKSKKRITYYLTNKINYNCKNLKKESKEILNFYDKGVTNGN